MVREMQRSPAVGAGPVGLRRRRPSLANRTIAASPWPAASPTSPRWSAGPAPTRCSSPSGEPAPRSCCAASPTLSSKTGVVLKVLPSVEEVVRRSAVGARRPRPPHRGPARPQRDRDRPRRGPDMLAGRRVLITGGGGSIGSEIARQVAEFDPDGAGCCSINDETHLHDAVAVDLGPRRVQLLCDIRDRRRVFDAVRRLPARRRLPRRRAKHVPLLEAPPVRGGHAPTWSAPATSSTPPTRPASSTSCSSRPTRPCDPSSVMGASKWLGEQLVLVAAAQRPPLRGALRQRARQPRQRRAHLHSPDRRRRTGHGHRPGDDPLLHEHPRGGPAGAPGGRARRRAGRSSCSTWASP